MSINKPFLTARTEARRAPDGGRERAAIGGGFANRGFAALSQGADVNGMHGTLKPLHCACMVADTDCVELLLQKGAEVKAFS